MKHIRNSNYLLIEGWMINELKLSGNELLIYAIIYGFSQDGVSSFQGSRQYLASFINASSLRTVDNTLKNLISKKLLVKSTEPIQCTKQVKVSYRAIKPEEPETTEILQRDWLNE